MKSKVHFYLNMTWFYVSHLQSVMFGFSYCSQKLSEVMDILWKVIKSRRKTSMCLQCTVFHLERTKLQKGLGNDLLYTCNMDCLHLPLNG